jgi:PPOX class probable F420-dependent enzyme
MFGKGTHMASFTLDRSNAFHHRAAGRLETEIVAWLVTIGADGTPQPSPIWFLWNGADQVLIYSQEMPKVKNIAARPRVALHFNSEGGGNIVIFSGSAVVDRSQPLVVNNRSYLDKYADEIVRIGMNNESFSAAYHVPVVMTIEKLRGH